MNDRNVRRDNLEIALIDEVAQELERRQTSVDEIIGDITLVETLESTWTSRTWDKKIISYVKNVRWLCMHAEGLLSIYYHILLDPFY